MLHYMAMQKRLNQVKKDITFFKLILLMRGRVGGIIRVGFKKMVEMPFGAQKIGFGILEPKVIFVATPLET